MLGISSIVTDQLCSCYPHIWRIVFRGLVSGSGTVFVLYIMCGDMQAEGVEIRTCSALGRLFVQRAGTLNEAAVMYHQTTALRYAACWQPQ